MRYEQLKTSLKQCFGPFELAGPKEPLTQNGTMIPLRAKSLDVLWLLVTYAGTSVSKHTFFEKIWDTKAVSEASLAVCIREIREALGDDARAPRYVQTMHGLGYRFIGKVEKTGTPKGPPVLLDVPLLDKAWRREGYFSRDDFRFDATNDRYICPGGKDLLPHRRNFQTIRDRVKDDETIRYRAAKEDCDACQLKAKCCPKVPARKITRSIHEGARDLTRDISRTDAYAASRHARKKVEMLFAHLKKIMGLTRLRLRGPNGAKDEFTVAAGARGYYPLEQKRTLETFQCYETWSNAA